MFAQAAAAAGLKPITGCELTVDVGGEHRHLTLLVAERHGYEHLCELITRAHAAHPRRVPTAPPTQPAAALADVLELAGGLFCLTGCARHGIEGEAEVRQLAEAFEGRLWVELQRPFQRGDRSACRPGGRSRAGSGCRCGHERRARPQPPPRRRCRTRWWRSACHATLDACEAERRGNREHVLKPPAEMAALFADLPEAVAATSAIADRIAFDLTRDLGYRPPATVDRAGRGARRGSAGTCSRTGTRPARATGRRRRCGSTRSSP